MPMTSPASPVIIKATIVVATVAPENIAETIRARSATVPSSVSRVVAVYKLAAFIVRVAKNPATAMASSAALAQSCCRNNDRQQQSHQRDSEKVALLRELLHKAPPSQLLVDVCRFVGRVSTLHLSRHQRYNNHRAIVGSV